MSCWASGLGNCEGGLSREHYISKGIFDKDIITASGLPWCKNKSIQIGLGRAVSKILCRKHNEALSIFDAEATKLSRFLLDQIGNNPQGHAELNLKGILLEKWLLKTAINLCHLGTFGNKHNFPTHNHLEMLFQETSPPNGMGLYLVETSLSTKTARTGAHWLDIRDTSNSSLVAVKFSLNGLQFLVCLIDDRADKKIFEGKELSKYKFTYRPREIVMNGAINAGDKIIRLEW